MKSYYGRFIDLYGQGLSLFLGKKKILNTALLYSAIGRLYSYKTIFKNNVYIVPTYTYNEGIIHALRFLEVEEFFRSTSFNSYSIDYVDFIGKIDDHLRSSRVLIGPIHCSCFENEFINSYIYEPMLCLILIYKTGNKYMCLHPDGHIFSLTNNELYNILIMSKDYTWLILSQKSTFNVNFSQDLPLKSVISGASIVAKTVKQHGSAYFIKMIIKHWDTLKKNSTNQLSLKYSLSNISINLLLLQDVLCSGLQKNQRSLTNDRIIRQLNDNCSYSISLCSEMTSHNSSLFKKYNNFEELFESWSIFEFLILKLLNHNKES
jgi:hypothetical protein